MARDIHIASVIATRRAYISDGWISDDPLFSMREGEPRVLFNHPEKWPERWRAYALRALLAEPDGIERLGYRRDANGTIWTFYRSAFPFGDYDGYKRHDPEPRYRFDLAGVLVTPIQLAEYLARETEPASEAHLRDASSRYAELRNLRA